MQGLNSYGSDSDSESQPSTSKLPSTSLNILPTPISRVSSNNSIHSPIIKKSIIKSNLVNLSNLSPKVAGKRRASSTSPPPFLNSNSNSTTREQEREGTIPVSDIAELGKEGRVEEVRESERESEIQYNSLSEFGIPPLPQGTPNPAVQAKLQNFYNLSISRGLHFNDSLSASKAFRNPRIYTKLVEFVNVVESASNWKKEFWNPAEITTSALEIGELQKIRSEQKANGQIPGSRSSIAFAPSSHQQSLSSHTHSQSKSEEGRNGKKSRWDSSESTSKRDETSNRNDRRENGRDRDRDRDGNGREKRSRSKSPRRRN